MGKDQPASMFARRRLMTTFGLGALLAACGRETTDRPPPRRGRALGGGPRPAPRPRLRFHPPPARRPRSPRPPRPCPPRPRSRGRGPALVLILGDSHAAGPILSERLRDLFQSRYGAIGQGRLPPARAQRFWNPAGLFIAQNGEWEARNALRSTSPGPFGLTGYRLTGARAGDTLTLRTTDPRGFDRISLTLATHATSGSFRLRAAGTPDTAHATATPAPTSARCAPTSPPGTKEMALELVGDGPIDLLGWGIDRRGRGVLVEAFGINGATLSTLDNRDPSILATRTRPDAAGAGHPGIRNQRGDGPRPRRRCLCRRPGAPHRALRTALPRSGIMLMGAPDAAARSPARAPPRQPARPATGCAGVTPLPSLATVKAAQRRAVEQTRAGFFDWSAEVTRDACRLPALAAASGRSCSGTSSTSRPMATA